MSCHIEYEQKTKFFCSFTKATFIKRIVNGDLMSRILEDVGSSCLPAPALCNTFFVVTITSFVLYAEGK